MFLGNPEDSVWEDWGTLGNPIIFYSFKKREPVFNLKSKIHCCSVLGGPSICVYKYQCMYVCNVM